MLSWKKTELFWKSSFKLELLLFMKKSILLTIVFVFIVGWVSLAVFLVKQKSTPVEKPSHPEKSTLDKSIVQGRLESVAEVKPVHPPVYKEKPSSLPPEPQHPPTVSGLHALNIDFGVWRPEPSKQIGPAELVMQEITGIP